MGVILAPTGAVLLALAVGFLPTRSLAGREGILAMAVGGGLSVLATILGSLPVVWAAIRSPQHLPALGLGASLFRVVALAVLAVPITILAELPVRPLLIWVGISYLVGLFAEVIVLVLLIKRLEARE